MRPSPEKVPAILNMPAPHDKSSIQRFMGMVNYLHKFIPHLADIYKPLRELLEKSVEWHWMERQQNVYQELIISITQALVLKYFDVSAGVAVSVVSPSLPISKMNIMLVYFICFGHNSILFCFLGSMLIKFEDLKFKLFNCSPKESCQGAIINNTKHVIFNSCTYHSALSPITFPCFVNERA